LLITTITRIILFSAPKKSYLAHHIMFILVFERSFHGTYVKKGREAGTL